MVQIGVYFDRCSNGNCSQLLFLSIKSTGVYLTFSNNINFPKCGIRWEMAFKPTYHVTYVRRKSCLPLYILCVELSRFLRRRLQNVYQNIKIPHLKLETKINFKTATFVLVKLDTIFKVQNS